MMYSGQGLAKVVLQGFSRAYGASKEKKGLRFVCALRTQTSTLFLFIAAELSESLSDGVKIAVFTFAIV